MNMILKIMARHSSFRNSKSIGNKLSGSKYLPSFGFYMFFAENV
jgi:hypothetical protein